MPGKTPEQIVAELLPCDAPHLCATDWHRQECLGRHREAIATAIREARESCQASDLAEMNCPGCGTSIAYEPELREQGLLDQLAAKDEELKRTRVAASNWRNLHEAFLIGLNAVRHGDVEDGEAPQDTMRRYRAERDALWAKGAGKND